MALPENGERPSAKARSIVERSRAMLEVIATVAIIMVCGMLLIQRSFGREPLAPARAAQGTPRPEIPPPTERIAIAGHAAKGNPTAKVALMIFSDFQCPFCRRFASDTLPEIQKAYVEAGRVLLIFHHMPLEQLHKQAVPAAAAAQCAERQHKFWEMHDLLFRDGAQLDGEGFTADAQSLGMQMKPFATCMSD